MEHTSYGVTSEVRLGGSGGGADQSNSRTLGVSLAVAHECACCPSDPLFCCPLTPSLLLSRDDELVCAPSSSVPPSVARLFSSKAQSLSNLPLPFSFPSSPSLLHLHIPLAHQHALQSTRHQSSPSPNMIADQAMDVMSKLPKLPSATQSFGATTFNSVVSSVVSSVVKSTITSASTSLPTYTSVYTSIGSSTTLKVPLPSAVPTKPEYQYASETGHRTLW